MALGLPGLSTFPEEIMHNHLLLAFVGYSSLILVSVYGFDTVLAYF